MALTKSARFPSVTLEFAIETIRQAAKFGTVLSDAHFTSSGSVRSGAFTRKKASLKYYGLIEVNGAEIRLTTLALSALSTNSQEKYSALNIAFLKPELFNTLYLSTQKGTALPVDMLGSIAMRDYGIQPKAKDEFVSTFVKSGIYAGLVRFTQGSREEVMFVEKNAVKVDEAEVIEKVVIGGGESQIVELNVTFGRAKVSVPDSFTPKDAEKLKKQIEIFVTKM